MMGGLAVAAITATALSLFHNHDATVLILVWNLGTTALIMGPGALFGRSMLRLPQRLASRNSMSSGASVLRCSRPAMNWPRPGRRALPRSSTIPTASC